MKTEQEKIYMEYRGMGYLFYGWSEGSIVMKKWEHVGDSKRCIDEIEIGAGGVAKEVIP